MGGRRLGFLVCALMALTARRAVADSVNSPNIVLSVDTNRSTGPGAGNIAVAVSTITLAETSLNEYASGGTQAITLRVRPGFQLDATSDVSALSATVGFNGSGVNVGAAVTPTGAADEVITFALTSGASAGQDVIRISGIKLRILDAVGAAGPAQTTMQITTASAGGAFTDQGIVAATIARGAADHLAFTTQPGNNAAGVDLLPAVKIVDFGGNIVAVDPLTISLALQDNPGAATLLGSTTLPTAAGVAAWTTAEHLRIGTAASGYTLRATHDGTPFLSADTADSDPFDIVAGAPGHLVITTQPVTSPAGESLVVAVTVQDDLDNPVTATVVPITLDLDTNPTGTSLLVSSSLTKDTVGGVATWDVADALRITPAAEGYRITASGVGAPVASDPFAIVPSAPNTVRYLQQPTDVAAGAVVDPPVQVEIVDEFGNRTDATAEVELTLLEAPCGGTLTGGTATAVDGVAVFGALRVSVPCAADVLKALTPGLGWAESEPFAVTGRAFPMALKSATMKPGQVAAVGRGPVILPDAVTENPTTEGGTLTITGSSGRVTHLLPAEAWTPLGPGGNGAKGFRFGGAVCKVVVKTSGVKAACTKTGTLGLPETGPLLVVLTIGSQRRYCGECGGTPKGQAAKVFKRRACAAPASCP